MKLQVIQFTILFLKKFTFFQKIHVFSKISRFFKNFTFFLKNVALTVSYIILLVAMHPNVQERLFQELRAVFASQDEDMTYEHMQQLPYLDQVIKEVLRLYPVGPFMVRRTTADVQLSNCVIPKNCHVTLSLFNLHRVRLNFRLEILKLNSSLEILNSFKLKLIEKFTW